MIRIVGRATPSRALIVSIVALFLFVTLLFAGNGKVAGRIVDAETGEPLVGANVVITHMILGDGQEVALDHPSARRPIATVTTSSSMCLPASMSCAQV